MMPQPESWHLDKRVPLALIVTIVLQSAAVVWGAASMFERLGQIERRQEQVERRAVEVERAGVDLARQIAVMAEASANTNRNLERLQGELGATNALLRDLLASRYRGAE